MMTYDMLSALQTAGVGTIGTTLFQGKAPAEVDTALVLNPYPGGPPLYPTDVENPGLVAWTRSTDYTAAWNLANAATHALGAIANSTVGGHRYLQVDALSAPGYMGQDEKGRHEFSVSFNVLSEAQS